MSLSLFPSPIQSVDDPVLGIIPPDLLQNRRNIENINSTHSWFIWSFTVHFVQLNSLKILL